MQLEVALLMATLTLTACAAVYAQDAAADLYVSPSGDDTWSGRRPEPNADLTDGPLATLHRAQEVARQLRADDPGRARPLVILVRAGTYFLSEPLVFSAEDSASPESPLVWAAYPGERPLISGGTRLSGFVVGEDGRWRLHIPEVERGDWAFMQLFVNGNRRGRPRLPKTGYYHIGEEVPPTPEVAGRGYDRFGFSPGELRADWRNLPHVEVLFMHSWSISRLPLGDVDEESGIATLAGHTAAATWWSGLQRGNRYIVENVAEALTEPGEFYLDRTTGELTYVPMPGEERGVAEVIAPRLPVLVELRGDPALGLWVSNIVFRGLRFAHSNWVMPPNGYAFPQAEANMPGAIAAVAAADCVLEDCRVEHVAGYAVDLGHGCKRNRVSGCILADLGAGGVKIGTMGYSQDEALVASGNVIENNYIAHGGRTHPAGVGVWIGHSPYNVIAHNTIYDFYYTGISVGWSWGYGPSNAHHNTIAYNDVHRIGQGVLSDMGGIYTLGISDGTVIHHNRFHDIESFGYGGWGIYFDEGTTHMLAENNVVYRTKSGGFHQHYGRENTVRNNIFAFAREGQLIRTRPEEHLSFTLERNIVYWSEGPLLGSNWSGDQYRLDYNVYWNVDGLPFDFAGMSLLEWQARGQDQHSIVADPLFVDPEADDYRLRPDSPALALGFQDIDPSGVGCTLPPGTELPPDMRPAFDPPPPPQPISEDFESTPVGKQAVGAQTVEENDQATARVSDEAAASGKHSLKFVDAPGQQANYNPHVVYYPGFRSGVVTAHFDIRLDVGGVLYHEWRDGSPRYRVGPSVAIDHDGWLSAGGRPLVQLPRREWVGVDIVCALGRDATGTWSLTVSIPGSPPARFEDLPCDPHMRHLAWFGFVADGTEDAVFYVDNIRVAPQP